ncbi:Ger(x)C family spore germination protein [Paenibacillus chondroitinus]|uniref:Ger(X)C family spore germination protein n=1 Tax=Paenibacillus chondroitinus TaxID=59842 RepID=A0ABU6DI21_9BACL|nr:MULTISPECIES: Ger(x)C family spore germination protein [Paenibacillus]MCY9658479.1 Ger(x)C family spore germination protein [Paenibacillus anseongense]MEB4797191.1 Ger(x)C family spore germination protein [Paenibacillus chondroitinus]
MLPRKVLCTLYLGCTLLLLTGCWDRVEINQRGFVVGVAIDKPEGDNGKNQYKGTYQMIVPGGLKQSSGSTTGQGNSMNPHAGQAYFNISTTENSMPAVAARIAGRTSRSPYFEHLRIIIISSDVAKNKANLPNVLDFFLRNSEMRRGVQILIADGKASDVLGIYPNNESTPIDYISSIAKNNQKTNFMLPESRIGDVHEYLIKNESFVLQTIKKEDGGVTLNGSALFDGTTKQLLGFLTGEETQGLNFITQRVKGGIIESHIDDQVVGFKVERSNRKFYVQQTSPGHMKFTIKIIVEGTLDKSITNIDPSEGKTVEALEKSLQDKLASTTNKTIKKLQHSYKKDALGLGPYLFQNHYKMWKPIAENWDNGENLFSQAEVDVQTKVIIRRIGNIFESTKEQ